MNLNKVQICDFQLSGNSMPVCSCWATVSARTCGTAVGARSPTKWQACIKLFTNVWTRDLSLTVLCVVVPSQGDAGETGGQGNPGHKVGHALMKPLKKSKSSLCCFTLKAVIESVIDTNTVENFIFLCF